MVFAFDGSLNTCYPILSKIFWSKIEQKLLTIKRYIHKVAILNLHVVQTLLPIIIINYKRKWPLGLRVGAQLCNAEPFEEIDGNKTTNLRQYHAIRSLLYTFEFINWSITSLHSLYTQNRCYKFNAHPFRKMDKYYEKIL